MQSQVFPSRFLAEVKSEPSRHLPVSPTHPHSPLNLSRLPRDFPSQATLHLCGCNQGAPRRSAGHRLGSETEPREPVTRQTPGPGPLRGYPGFWRNWSVRRKALWNFHLRTQVLGSKLGDIQAFKGWGQGAWGGRGGRAPTWSQGCVHTPVQSCGALPLWHFIEFGSQARATRVRGPWRPGSASPGILGG